MKDITKYSDSEMNMDMDMDFAELERELEGLSLETNPEYEEIIAKRINREIRNRLRKAGIIAAVIAVAVTLFCVFVLPKLVDMMYYNPAEVLYNEADRDVCQLEQDVNNYAEAVLPEWGPGLKASAASRGFGNYTFYIQRDFNTRNHEELRYNDAYAGEISRGNASWYDIAKNEPLSRNSQIAFSEMEGDLTELADNTDYYSYVSFKEDVSYDELLGWFNENKDEYKLDNSFVWCAVRNSDKDELNHNYGFRMFSGESGSQAIASEEEAEKHFLGLMEYIGNNDDFAWVMDAPSGTDSYRDTSEYVRSNGMKIYGIVIIAEKAELMKLADSDMVRAIVTASI